MRFAGRTLTLQGALLALICFFLPWVTVSCGERTSTLSGVKMAFGGTVQTNQGPEQRDPDVFMLLLFLFGISLLLLVVFAWMRHVQSRGLSIALIVISGLSLLILMLRYLNQQTDTSGDVPIYVTYHAGFWGTVIGYVLALIGGVLDLITKPSQRDLSPP
jgi:hypothetical protein